MLLSRLPSFTLYVKLFAAWKLAFGYS